MIKTTYRADVADVEELFRENGFRLAPIGFAEADAYDGTLTLSDEEEHVDGDQTTLWLSDDGFDACVTDEDGNVVEEEPHATLADALEAYERLSVRNRTSATRVVM